MIYIYIYRCPLYIQNSCCSDFNQEIHGTSCFYLETYQTNTHTLMKFDETLMKFETYLQQTLMKFYDIPCIKHHKTSIVHDFP